MNDEKDKTKDDNEQQSRVEAIHSEEAVGKADGVLLMDRPPKRGTIEVKGPPGMAVVVGGDEWCTKIVLHLPLNDEGAWKP